MSSPSRRRVLRRLGAAAVVPLAATGTGRRAAGVVDAGRGASGTDDHVEWRTTAGDDGYWLFAMVGVGDGVVLAGRIGVGRSSTPWVAKVGADGTERWTTTFEPLGPHPRSERGPDVIDVAAVDGGYAVLGNADQGPPLGLVGLDGKGQEIWRRRLQGRRVSANVLQGTDDGYLVGGYRYRSGSDAWLLATDDRGARRWERTYDADSVLDIVPWSDGFLLAGEHGGDAWLRAVGTDGTPGWRHTYGGVGSEAAGTALPAGEGILYGGTTTSMPDPHADWRTMLVRTTGDGALVWRRTYDATGLVGLVPFGDGAAVAGDTPDRNRFSGARVHVVDRWGRVERAVEVDGGEPHEMARFDDGAPVVAGMKLEDSIWLAKLALDG